MTYRSIALDGPAGAGKSTLAKRAAEALGFLYVDTGAIYRTVGLCARRRGVTLENIGDAVGLLGTFEVDMRYGGDGLQHMYLDGEDVTRAIREPEISMYASAVSALPEVRAFLMEMQRDMARKHDVIMDGRDIGTVVLPRADVKIFLTASPEARARRRYEELLSKGAETDYESVLEDMLLRDRNDSSRAAAPLKQAKDALLLDTTEFSLDESFDVLLQIIKERLEL